MDTWYGAPARAGSVLVAIDDVDSCPQLLAWAAAEAAGRHTGLSIVHACPRQPMWDPATIAEWAPEHLRVRQEALDLLSAAERVRPRDGPGCRGSPHVAGRSASASDQVRGPAGEPDRSGSRKRTSAVGHVPVHRPFRLTGQCGRLHRPDGSSATDEPGDRDPAARPGQLYGARRPRRGTDHGTTTQVAGDGDGGLVRHLAGGSGRIDPEGPGAHVRRRRPRDAVHGRAFIDATAGRGPHRSNGRARRHTPRPGPCRDRTPRPATPVQWRDHDVHPPAVVITQSQQLVDAHPGRVDHATSSASTTSTRPAS